MAYTRTERYTPKPVRLPDETREHVEKAAERSTSLQVLLNHITYLEEERRAMRTVLLDEFVTNGELPMHLSYRMSALLETLAQEAGYR